MPVPNIPAHVAQAAVEWMVTLQSRPLASGALEKWEHWRKAHPDHERAWERIETMNSRFERLSYSPAASALAHATLAPPASRGRRRAMQVLAVALFTGSTAWGLHTATPWPERLADLRTARGERRILLLDDGTQLVLNTGSAVDVRFSRSERRLRLLTGEIYIATNQDPASVTRPFLVETRDGEALALGTRFSVQQYPEATRVAVFEGAVRLQPAQQTAEPRVLSAGEQADFMRTVSLPAHRIEESTPHWVDGVIVANGMRLADFLAELSRYSEAPLTCDASVAGLRISGTYPVADVGKVLDTLSAALSLRIDTTTRFWGRQVVGIRLTPGT